MRPIRAVLLIVAALYGIVLASGLGVFDHAPGPSNAFAYEYSTTITTSTSNTTTTTTSTSTGPACLHTLGFFKNHPEAVVGGMQLDSQSLTASQALAVLRATPGSHSGVTFTSNSLLTLAQQVLAAELNIAAGANPPASVTQALQQANAGLNVTISGGVVAISGSLTKTQISSLTNTLSRFNEGRLGGGISCKS
jgi:hypothetical protein